MWGRGKELGALGEGWEWGRDDDRGTAGHPPVHPSLRRVPSPWWPSLQTRRVKRSLRGLQCSTTSLTFH